MSKNKLMKKRKLHHHHQERRHYSAGSLDVIPEDVLIYIMCKLELQFAKTRFALVCRRFYALAKHPHLWSIVELQMTASTNLDGILLLKIPRGVVQHFRLKCNQKTEDLPNQLSLFFKLNQKFISNLCTVFDERLTTLNLEGLAFAKQPGNLSFIA